MGFRRTREIVFPPSEVLLITPSDSTEYDPPLRAVSVGTAGTLKVDTPNTTGVVIPANALIAGVQHTCLITKIYAASTATGIVGWR